MDILTSFKDEQTTVIITTHATHLIEDKEDGIFIRIEEGNLQWEETGGYGKVKKAAYNLGYFLKEAKTLFKLDFFSNLFSIISIGLIFFILALVISGWEISNYVIEIVEKEAEINVYYDTKIRKRRN